MADHRPKRLVIDARWVGPKPTGVGNSILRHLAGLDQLPQITGRYPEWEVFAIRAVQSLESEAVRAAWDEYSSIRTIDVSASPESHPASDWWLLRKLPRLLAQLDADVLYSPAYVAPPRTGRTARVVMVHDDLIWAEPRSYPLKFRMYLGTASRLATATATRVIFPSADARDRVAARLGLAPERLGVVPHGIDPTRYDNNRAAARQSVAVFVASAEHRKNHIVLLNALAHLQSGSMLRFLGFNPEGARLAGLRRDFPQQWESIPQASSQKVGEELARAAMMVHPSRGEGFGLPLLEAMACGTPMILSDIPVLHEVAGDAALFVSPDDPLGWAQAIDRLAGDAALRSQLVEAGRQRLQRFTLGACARTLLEEMERAAASKQHSRAT